MGYLREAGGVRTTDGKLHELDVLVLATGFHVDAFVRPMAIRGLDGVMLDDVWKDRPSAYMSIGVQGFPNFFMINGPNSPVGNFSLIRTAEMQFEYLMKLVDHVAAAKQTVWATGCRSWYLADRGIPFLWPFSFTRFTQEMEKSRFEDYAIG